MAQMSFDVKEAATDADLARIYPAMRELRPHIKTETEFVERAQRQRKNENWRLIYIEDAGKPVAAAGFRISEWLAWGRALYVDDLICLESGKGFAEALMRWMEDHARREGCAQFHLDSGTHRLAAHRFYHRLKLAITSFHFQKSL